MSGADLANVINEAALLTARENGTVITEASLEESVDRVVGGPRRKSRKRPADHSEHGNVTSPRRKVRAAAGETAMIGAWKVKENPSVSRA